MEGKMDRQLIRHAKEILLILFYLITRVTMIARRFGIKAKNYLGR